MPATTARAAKSHAGAPRRHEKAAVEIDQSLEKTQAALALLRADLGRDGKRIASDIEKLLRSARRDLTKLSRAIESDLERESQDGAVMRPGSKPSRR